MPLKQDAYQQLLLWLAKAHGVETSNLPFEYRQDHKGGGLYATRPILAEQVLLTLPPSALLNKKTLSKLYNSKLRTLSSTQLLGIHLAFYRHCRHASEFTEERFIDLINIMPAECEGMPLWHLQGEFKEENAIAKKLIALMPLSVQRAITDVENRFLHDLKVAQASCQSELGVSLSKADFLWAWSCINSRCVYSPLGFKDEACNFSLAPIVELANHDPDSPLLFRIDQKKNLILYSSMPSTLSNTKLDARFKALYSANSANKSFKKDSVVYQEGQEINLPYGRHSQGLLLADYGFVLERNEAEMIDLESVFLAAMANLPMEERKGKMDLLTEFNLLSGLCLDPRSKEPSWNLMNCIRLFALEWPAGVMEPEEQMQRWMQVLNGITHQVTFENESKSEFLLKEFIKQNNLQISQHQFVLDRMTNALPVDQKARLASLLASVGKILEDQTVQSLSSISSNQNADHKAE